MRIGIAFDLVPVDRGGDGPDDRYEEFDRPETVEAIAEVIRGEGHDVALLGDGPEFLRRVLDDPPDFVWNMAEGQGVGRCREARVPAALEMLGIPYSGSDPLTLAAALDKDVARRLVARGASVPKGWACEPGLPPDLVAFSLRREFDESADFPLILKPNAEGSSKGIRGRGLADTVAEAADLYDRLGRDYAQPVLFEQFIDGPEVTVGMVGNAPEPEILGLMRIVPREPTERFVYSLEVKRDWRRRVEYEAPARLPDDVECGLRQAAFTVYNNLGCRDLVRIDFRLKDGVPYFIEANPLPGLAPVTSDLVILARGYGISHADLIRKILHVALVRVGLARPEPVAP